jgi:sec-independent protein translocase protein TatC
VFLFLFNTTLGYVKNIRVTGAGTMSQQAFNGQKLNWTRISEWRKEIKRRLIYCFLFFVSAAIIGFVFSERVIRFIKDEPIAKQMQWHVFALADALSVYIKASLLIGLMISIPFFLYQVWQLVKPTLQNPIQRAAFRYIPWAAILFIVGISFGYFAVFPLVLSIMMKMTQILNVDQMFGITEYFSFMISIVLPFGTLFELPIVVIFLTKITVIDPNRLKKWRKNAYFVLIAFATSIAPPELVSNLLVIIPLLLLYECSVWISQIVYRFDHNNVD